jgi:protein-ribulosamine 3-kinase
LHARQVFHSKDSRSAAKGEYEATLEIHRSAPKFCPEPITWGGEDQDGEGYFYVCEWLDFVNHRPNPEIFCKQLADLHSNNCQLDSAFKLPENWFGFHCATYSGDLPQDITGSPWWEIVFVRLLKKLLQQLERRTLSNKQGVPEESAELSKQLDGLKDVLFSHVIPRLLRPLQYKRKLKPSFVHGDLWIGNVEVVSDVDGQERAIIFDPASFYAHNECK